MRSPMLLACTFIFTLFAVNATPAPPAWCAAAQNWVLLDENRDSSFYYDQSGTTTPKEGLVRVKTRVVYTRQGRDDALKILAGAKELAKLHQSRYVHDLNCAEQESRLLEATHLDKEGVVLKSTDLAPFTEWEMVPPEARLSLVADRVCRR